MDLQDTNAVNSSSGPIAGIPAADENQPLEFEIVAVGDELLTSLRNVLAAVPRAAPGPQALARALGVDKVLASRILKATRNKDPMSATHSMPGPDPLRRLVKAAAKRGASAEVIADAGRAIDNFETLIRERIGDRSLLDAILSAWVPEARREFELRRKQSAFKAMSQLKGVQAEALLATVVLHPSADGKHIDVVWVNGLIGVHRVRPGVGVKLSTRRMNKEDSGRQPVSLDGKPVENIESLELREFCTDPMPRLHVQRVGEVVHYTLAGEGFGPNSAVDVVFAEANISELKRYVPGGTDRKAHFFAEVVTPSRLQQFDALIHEDLFPGGGGDPTLRIYDTSFEGVANVNDRSRDLDVLDLMESIEPLGVGTSRFRSSHVPRYQELVKHVFDRMAYDGSRFRGYRCRVDYPVYGSQVVMMFEPEVEP